MIDPANTPEDEALRRLYRQERPEPHTRLDDHILDAARAAVAAGSPRRKWRYPVGVGAAASALLAVLLFQQAPETALELERIKTAPASESTQIAPPATPMVVAPADDHRDTPNLREEDRALRAISDAAAPPQTLAKTIASQAPASSAQYTADFTPVHEFSHRPERLHRELEEAAVADSRSNCAPDTTALTADGLMLCITDESIEAHDLAKGCEQPLSLGRPTTGAVSIERTQQAITISIAGASYWRVQCLNGTWRVDALR